MKSSTTAQQARGSRRWRNRPRLGRASAVSVARQGRSRPGDGMSRAEYRALVIRSEALNQKYHLGHGRASRRA